MVKCVIAPIKRHDHFVISRDNWTFDKPIDISTHNGLSHSTECLETRLLGELTLSSSSLEFLPKPQVNSHICLEY